MLSVKYLKLSVKYLMLSVKYLMLSMKYLNKGRPKKNNFQTCRTVRDSLSRSKKKIILTIDNGWIGFSLSGSYEENGEEA